MRALVTGAAGFIGSHLVERLATDGWDVVAVDDLSGGTRVEDLIRWWAGLGVEFHKQPTSQTGVIDHLPLDAVFHLASPVGPVGVLYSAGRIAQSIVNDSLHAAAIARHADAPLVYVATSELYGLQPGPAPETAYCVFGEEHSARQEYAVGKLAAEVALLNTDGLDVRIVRPFNVAGPRQRPGGGFVIPRWIQQHRAGERITVYGNGSQRRAFCHVTDFVDGMVRVLDRGRPGVRYNLGNPDNRCTLTDLAHTFCDLTGALLTYVDPVALHGDKFREAPDKVPVIDRARTDLGWSPTLTNEDIIRDALAA